MKFTKNDFDLIKEAITILIHYKEQLLSCYCLGDEKSYKFKQELEKELENLYQLRDKLK